jgi:ribosomal subunit interface protein
MEISVKGKHFDVGDALRGHVKESLDAGVRKYFTKALNSTVVFSREKHRYRADISVHAGRGLVMQGRAVADEPYPAFDGALDRISKQLRRYKRRLTNHHKGHNDQIPAQYTILAPESDEVEVADEGQPTIVAEMPTEIATLTTGEAVMRMDLANAPIMMFRNSAHGGLNVVYRREDGNIGWIDPSGMESSKG